MRIHNEFLRAWTRVVAAAAVLHGCAAHSQNAGRALEGFTPVDEVSIVDCLLPPEVRRVGGRVYLTPRRPTRTTAADCATRGGEFTVYDRADYRAALRIWQPTAELGDAEAQTMVGEIFERGLGAEPNYEAAIEWYRKAAAQGHSRAQFNLGTLYELGLGVPVDRLEALNWYRRSSGLAEDSVIFKTANEAELAEIRAGLEREIEQRDRQIEALGRQVAALEAQLRDRQEAGAEIQSLRELLGLLQGQQETSRGRLQGMPMPVVADTAPGPDSSGPKGFEEPETVQYRRRSFGRYYALIIGVQNYELLDDLQSPLHDVARMAQVLDQRYGFSVVTLTDPDQLEVMRAVNQLNDTLTEEDNLLIYFAGHGSRLQSGVRETGYWLPTNAEQPPNDTLWVPNEFVSRHLGRLRAKRILVVSDSCYAGMLGDDPGYVMVGEGRYSDDYIEWKLPKRSRLVLASGADQPVLDAGGGENSVFARALLDELESNQQVLSAPELFLRVRQRVLSSRSTGSAVQEPQLKAIKDAGHEVGDFFFVPG